MDKDEKLEQLMQSYNVPPASNNLAERIIDAAPHVQQKQSIWRWVDRVFEEFRLPAPVYSLTSLLIIGFLAGFITYNGKDINVAPDTIVEQLLDEDEAL